ncbi:MAG TPA: hypothetical protein VE464_23490 [Streptosporangiaceae bacterium]|nr:hypothetical protein [Streptosporangiaceae bacterium]
MPILLLLAAAVILAGVVSVAMGHGGEMAEFATDYLPPDLVSAADVVLLRPPSALWGYNVQVTDEALNRIAQAITERDVEIAVLRQQLAELRSATGSHPAIAATLLARSKAASTRGSAVRKASTPEVGTRETSAGQAGSPGGPVPPAAPPDPPSPEQGTPGGDGPRNGAAGTLFPGSGAPRSGEAAAGRDD